MGKLWGHWGIAGIGLLATGGWAAEQPGICSKNRHGYPKRCDVVIVDSSLGAVAAALKASRILQGTGKKVCMTSTTNWIGGQMSTQGVAAVDFSGSGGVNGTEGRFSSATVAEESMQCFSAATRHMKLEASGFVSNAITTPKNANLGLQEMLKPYVDDGTLTVLCDTVPIHAYSADGKITKVRLLHRMYTGNGPKPHTIPFSEEVEDWYDPKERKMASPARHSKDKPGEVRYAKQSYELKGAVFIDGSDTGELTALAEAGYHVGAPGDEERVSGSVYPSLIENRPLTEADRQFLQRGFAGYSPDGNPRFNVFSTARGGSMHGVYRRTRTNRSGETVFGNDVFHYRSMPRDQTGGREMSMNNWERGNDGYDRRDNVLLNSAATQAQVSGGWSGGWNVAGLKRLEQRSYAFDGYMNDLWIQDKHRFLQEHRSEGYRGAAPVWSEDSANTAFGTGTGLSRMPYIREGRRMETLSTLTAADVEAQANDPDAATHFGDALGTANYGMDTRLREAGRGGLAGKKPKLYQFRLGNIVAKRRNNLFAATKNLGVDQQVASSLRTHPAEFNVGAASGTAAAVSILHGVDAHQLARDPALVKEIQSRLNRGGCPVSWFDRKVPEHRCDTLASGEICCSSAPGPQYNCGGKAPLNTWQNCSLGGSPRMTGYLHRCALGVGAGGVAGSGAGQGRSGN